MTAIQHVYTLLDGGWTESREGRVLDVPKPEIHLENDQTQVDLGRHDELVVQDGGPVSQEPLGIGRDYEREELTMSVEITSAERRVQGAKVDSRARMFGYVNTGGTTDEHGLDPGEQEEHGGLVGEVKKIVRDAAGPGQKLGPFDDIFLDGVDDLSGTVAVNKHRAVVNIRLRDRTVEL